MITKTLTTATRARYSPSMIRLSVSTRISVEEPFPDGGFITWYDVLIQRDNPVVDDDGVDGDDLAKI